MLRLCINTFNSIEHRIQGRLLEDKIKEEKKVRQTASSPPNKSMATSESYWHRPSAWPEPGLIPEHCWPASCSSAFTLAHRHMGHLGCHDITPPPKPEPDSVHPRSSGYGLPSCPLVLTRCPKASLTTPQRSAIIPSYMRVQHHKHHGWGKLQPILCTYGKHNITETTDKPCTYTIIESSSILTLYFLQYVSSFGQVQQLQSRYVGICPLAELGHFWPWQWALLKTVSTLPPELERFKHF